MNSSPNLFKLYQFFWKTKEEMADRQMSPFSLFLTLSYFWTAKLSLLSKMEAQKTWYCNFGSDYDEIMIFFSRIRSGVSASKNRNGGGFENLFCKSYLGIKKTFLFSCFFDDIISSRLLPFFSNLTSMVITTATTTCNKFFLTSFQKKFSQNSDLMTCNVEYSWLFLAYGCLADLTDLHVVWSYTHLSKNRLIKK